mmetsp:Transcript_93816/g.268619  ORF Transcript_93816/g.268619 Transcript_93816/m.268619 type:complete len:552 (-) Transcript_93816:574-2229(-)
MQSAEALVLFDRLDTNKDGVLTPSEWAANAWESSVGKHMSYASAESDFISIRHDEQFKSLDSNNDGVLSREEVVAGAWRFNMQAHEASALFDRLDTNKDGVLHPHEWAANAWDSSVGKHMSYASAESDFISIRHDEQFKSLDSNNDGVLSREEVVAGAWRFNMQAHEASALFDRLDTNKDGVLHPHEWAANAWDSSVGKHMSYASALSDFSAVRQPEYQKEAKAAAETEEAVAMYMSFASPESDFVAPRAAELEAEQDAPPAMLNWLLFPTSINFAGADNDWCAPTAAEIKAADAYQNPTSISWSTPFSDWVGPSKAEISGPAYETYLSFAGAESDFTMPTQDEIQASIDYSAETADHAHLSYAGAESDVTMSYAGEMEAADVRRQEFDSSSLSYAHLSFATPTSDFSGAYPKEAEHNFMQLSEALAPSNEARVLTSADGRFRIQHVNNAWTRLCGYSMKEASGKTLGLLQGDATDDKAVEELVSQLREGKSTEAVLINYDKYGRKFRNHLKTTPVVSDETGEITHFLGVLRNIGGENNEQLVGAQAVITP